MRRKEWFYIIIDHFSLFVRAFPISPAPSSSDAWHIILKGWIANFGTPTWILSDNASIFTSQFVEEKLLQYGIRHTKSTPYYPQGNGICESFNKVIIRGLSIMSAIYTMSVEEITILITMAHNATPTIAGETPFTLITGMDLR